MTLTSLHLKDKLVLFTPLHFYQGPRSRKSLCSSFESQWCDFFSPKFFSDSLSVITLVGLN